MNNDQFEAYKIHILKTLERLELNMQDLHLEIRELRKASAITEKLLIKDVERLKVKSSLWGAIAGGFMVLLNLAIQYLKKGIF